MSNPEEFIPIGIDLGSLHARVAIGSIAHHKLPSKGTVVDTRPLPNVISNAQGSRFTLALVGVDKSHTDDGSSEEERLVFGDAARRALARDKKPTISKDPSSMIRELIKSSSSVSDTEERSKTTAAFFEHLSVLACDASSSHPSKLRTVVSVPVASTPEEQVGIVQSVERGIREAMAARKEDGGKSKKKTKNDVDGNVVVGVISDPAAICIAHGLTETENEAIDFTGASSNTATSWRNVLVIDWGASGLTATHVRRASPNSALLSIIRNETDTSCSGVAIVDALVSHCASMFERKNRVSGVLDSVKAHHRLEMACESAVRTLSRAPTTTVTVDGLYEGMDMSVPISRPRFDMMINGILHKAEALLSSFIVDGEEFDAVLVAGNVCDMPSSTTLIRTKLFPNAQTGRGDVPADEAVAIGCARHAAAILSCGTHSKSNANVDGLEEATKREVTLCPLTIGICIVENGKEDGEVLDSTISKDAVPLIEVGEPLPANVTRSIHFGDLSSSSIAIVQMNGGCSDVKNKLIGKIDGIDTDAKSVEVTVELTAEGSLTLSINGEESYKLC